MRLIDADALLATSSGVTMIIPTNIHPHEAIKIQGNAFREAVEKAPTVDAVEVVRCKDCEHWQEHDGEMFCHCYANLMTDTAPNDFCSYGERREDG